MTTTEGNLHAAQTTLRLRGETRAQHLSVSEPPQSAASHFPPKSSPVPDTKGTTRHQTPGVRAAQAAPQCASRRLSPPHLARSSPVARGKRAARVRWELSPAHKKPLSSATASSQKEHTARVCKHCHNLSYALPTAAAGLKTALLRNTLARCKRNSIRKVATGARNSLRMTHSECEGSGQNAEMKEGEKKGGKDPQVDFKLLRLASYYNPDLILPFSKLICLLFSP